MAVPLAPVEVIERSRRGDPVDADSLAALVRGWLDGTADDAQLAAWCMLACLRGLEPDRVEALAHALIASGDRLELGSLGATGQIDSTGAVGDASLLAALPAAAALGVTVASVAGRGVAHLGGTIDRLEAIPGYRAELPLGRLVRQLRETGIAVVGAGGRLAPAERRLEALRDATATAPSAGLAAAGTMARALAGGARAIVVELPAGPAGLLPDPAAAREAGAAMAALAALWGRSLRVLEGEAERPPGRCVGNSLEVGEAAAVLGGGGPPALRASAARLAGALAEEAGLAAAGEGPERALAAIDSGEALRAAERWVEAQEGDPAVWSEPERLPRAPVRIEVAAPASGRLGGLDARRLGEAARWLGAGRLHASQSVDPAVGIELLADPGEPLEPGRPAAQVHARDSWSGERAAEMVAAALAGEGGDA